MSLTLTLIVTLGLFSVPALAADSPSSWAADQVNKAIEAGLVPQSLQSKYTQATTRAEFCALAVALYENVKGTITGRTTFTDTKDVNVEKMASVGVVSGIGNNKFDPDAKLTREQAAVMLSRLADAIGKPFEKKAATFADNGKVSSWALEGVGQVQAAGIMSGTGNNMFSPKDPYTREQSIITIMRTYDAVKGAGTTEPTDPTSGSIDKALVGEWYYEVGATNYYKFKDDGTFFYYQIIDSVMSSVEGKYSTANGKVYLTEMVYASRTTLKDQVLDYSSGSDGEGAYLSIPPIKYIFPDSDEKPYQQPIKFRPYK